MPFGMDTAPRERVEADNRHKIKDGTRNGVIKDVFLYNVQEVTENGRPRRKYTPEPSNEQDVQIKVAFKARPDIVLQKTMRAYVGKKAKFAKLIQELLGIQPGNDLVKWLAPEVEKFDVKEASTKLRRALVGMEVLMTTQYDAAKETASDPGYTNITDLKPLPIAEAGDDLQNVPLQRNPSQQREPQTAAQCVAEEPMDDELDWSDLDTASVGRAV